SWQCHAVPLKIASTVMSHFSRSHSGMYTRFLFRSHQVRSSREEIYISGVSCSCLTCSSNSVASMGARGIGRPQLGFPRLLSRPDFTEGIAGDWILDGNEVRI